MPINIKNGGTWSNGTPFIKNSGSWSTAKQVFAKVGGVWQTVYTSAISDNFDRDNSSTLGTVPDTDYAWNDTRGLWQISSSAAYSPSLESAYPIADIEFSTQNVMIQATINATGTSQSSGKYGGGIAFWIVDSENWWGAYNDTVRTGTTTYSCASTYNGKTLTSQVGTTCNYDYSATATTTSTCTGSTIAIAGLSNAGTSSCAGTGSSGPSCWSGSQIGTYTTSCGPCCAPGSGTRCPSGTTYYDGYGRCYNNVSSAGYSTSTSYSCPSGGTLSGTTCLLNTTATGTTTYSYSHKLKLINAINNSIAVVNTYTINDNVWIPANIKATISNNTITFNAYANDDNTGSSWNQVYTAISPNKGTKHGLLLAPKGDENVTQATSLDNFSLSAV